MVFCNLPFYFHRALNYLYVHLDIWASISLSTGVKCVAISSKWCSSKSFASLIKQNKRAPERLNFSSLEFTFIFGLTAI